MLEEFKQARFLIHITLVTKPVWSWHANKYLKQGVVEKPEAN